jgi:hypothetical protein
MLELAGRLASTIRSTLWVQNVVVVFHFVDGWFPGDNDLSINAFHLLVWKMTFLTLKASPKTLISLSNYCFHFPLYCITSLRMGHGVSMV